MKALILLLQIFCFAMLANSANCDYFGANLKLLKDAKTYNGVTDFSGDYNGDGIQDRLVFMYLPSKPQFAKDVNVVYMFGDDSKPEYKHKEGSIGLAFILSDKAEGQCKKYIIYDDGYLAADKHHGWYNTSRFPINFVKKNSELYLYYLETQGFDVKTDAIEFISEASVGALIYWNGETFNAQWANEYL